MISIIVPVYNVEQYLERCVKSIIAQTYKNLEIILVDDGSTDKSGWLCDVLKKRDKRICVIHKRNGGLSDARNAGIEIAHGSYIGFVDSDDWIEPEMYEDLLTAMQKSNAPLAVTGITRIYPSGYSSDQFVSKKKVIRTNEEIIRSYLCQNVFSTAAWDKLYSKDLFGKRRFPVGKAYEDAPIIYDIISGINCIAIVGKPQYHYFQRTGSICNASFSEKNMDHYKFSKWIYQDVSQRYPNLSNEADIFWGCKLCEILYSLYESDNRPAFRAEENTLYSQFKQVGKCVIKDRRVPNIMRAKSLLAMIHLIPIYNKIKEMKVRGHTQTSRLIRCL